MHSGLYSNEFNFIIELIVSGNQDLGGLKNQIDESILSDLMSRHRIGPYVYSKLSSFGFWSDSFHEKWKKETIENQKSALLVKGFQGKLTSHLDKRGIRHVYLKGVELSEKYYSDLALRHVLDLDILVAEKDIDIVSEVLLQLGYRKEDSYSRLSKMQKKFLRYVNHDMQFIATLTGLPVLIELHWKWRGSLGGFAFDEIRKLDEVELFLYLVVHGTEHAWFRLKWLIDIYKIVEQVKFDWALVKQKAVLLNCLTHLEISFLVLKKIFSTQIPELFSYAEFNKQHEKKIKYIVELISSEAGFNENDTNRIRHFFYMQSLSKRKINFPLLLKYVISPKDWELIRLPNSLFFMYIPLRPIAWIIRKLKG